MSDGERRPGPSGDELEEAFAADVPAFAIGQIVRHRRYGYRGVVVDFDMRCEADEAWYKKNRTQPEREQPWYHVLVHASGHTTYAAQSSLEPDPGREPIEHPWLGAFFHDFDDGRYERNDRPWPGFHGP